MYSVDIVIAESWYLSDIYLIKSILSSVIFTIFKVQHCKIIKVTLALYYFNRCQREANLKKIRNIYTKVFVTCAYVREPGT
jgi:hypothetical protein